MNPPPKPSVPFWYWAVAALALLWNLIGCAAFAGEVFAQEAMMESMTDAQKEWARSTPGWIYFVYFIAVATGVVGSVGLLLRQRWTVAVFALSLAAIVIQMLYTMVLAGGLQVMGIGAAVLPCTVIFLAAAFLWFSWFARGKGWLGG